MMGSLSLAELNLPTSADIPLAQNLSLRADYLAYGRQSSAYFIFQQGVRSYEGSLGGRVHYAQQSTPFGPINFVMTNPLCPPAQLSQLLAEFDQAQTAPNIYVAVDQSVAQALRAQDYSINQVGVENSLALADFHLHGKKKKQLRHASHFGERTTCHVEERSWAEVDQQQVLDISLDWVHSKVINSREIRYATRPAVFDDEWRVRKFYCMHQDKVVAYAFFDPYFEQGKLLGYCANILRSRSDKRYNGALDFTVLEAIKTFQQEGVAELSLGIAPFHNIQAEPNERKFVRWASNWFYHHGNNFYAFKALAYHKSRYRPQQTPWYLCMKDVSLARAYWGLLFGVKALGKREL